MADPLSIGASVVGIIVPVLHGSRLMNLLISRKEIIDNTKLILYYRVTC